MAFQLLQDCIDMDVEMSASSHAVLVILCRHANDAGECFPSTALIAKKAHLNPRTVMQAVRELEQDAWITCTQQPGKKRRFVVDVAKVKALVTPVENCTPAKSTTPAVSYTPVENCTPAKSGTPAENCSTPLQKVTGDPCRKLQTNKTIREQEETTTDIRPKLSDTAETVEDFGLDDAVQDAPVLTLESEDEQKADRVPVQKFVDLYNEILGAELGTCQKVTPARRQLIQARYRDICKDCKCANEQEGLFMTRKYFECVKRSDFLMGRVKQWRATFDWLIKQANYTKILEGTYNNGRR